MALAAFWALGVLAEPLRLLAPLLPRHESPVSSQEIRVPQHEHGVCQHHPRGCPKDCFCPKLDPQAAAAAAAAAATSEARMPQGTVAEPALDHCTETVENSLHPRWLILDFAPVASRPAAPEFARRVPPRPPPRPADPFAEPPLKVPVA